MKLFYSKAYRSSFASLSFAEFGQLRCAQPNDLLSSGHVNEAVAH